MQRSIQVRNSAQTSGLVSYRDFAGIPHTVVSGVGHIVADAVMNGILYPLSAVSELCDKLSGPNVYINAPLRHPEIDGNFVSASHPLAIQINGIGAFAYNFRMAGDRLISDLAINEEVASRLEAGAEVVRRIKEGLDCDMSTGLWLSAVADDGIAMDGEPYSYVAADLELDHVAMLPDQVGAASSVEGVGLYANRAMTRGGEMVDLDVAAFNASAAAMRLPLAPSDYEWDYAAAEQRIRELTRSSEQPGSNYRKFHFWFDRAAVGDFASYKLPFADVIDGVPHAVPAALVAAKAALTEAGIPETELSDVSGKIEEYLSRIEAPKQGTKVWDGIINAVKLFFSGNKQQTRVDPMKDLILAALNAKGIQTDGLDEVALMAAYNEMLQGQEPAPAVESELVAVVNSLKSELEAVKQTISANKDAEKDALVAEVVALDIGICAEDAKLMGVNSLRNVLAKRGNITANASSEPKTAAEIKLLDDTLPE